jgi:hypothetical protein
MKKNNLFVIHTQYCLILSTGLIKNRFKNDYNELILFKDFKINENVEKKIESIFNESLILDGTLKSQKLDKISKFKLLLSSNKKIKNKLNKKYDRVFLVTDMSLPELKIMNFTNKLSSDTEYIWLEDGSYPYFQNVETNGGFDKNNFTRSIRSFIFKYIFNIGKFYSFSGRFMGANTWINKAYLTYPRLSRDIYQDKQKIEISSKEFDCGITSIYDTVDLNSNQKFIFIVFDLFSVYKNKEYILNYLDEFYEFTNIINIPVYFKFHPREIMNFEKYDRFKELDRNLAVESYYASFSNKNSIIIGIKSTALQTAKKMNFNVISIAEMFGEHNDDLINFYNNIGVQNFSDIKSFFNELKIMFFEKL